MPFKGLSKSQWPAFHCRVPNSSSEICCAMNINELHQIAMKSAHEADVKNREGETGDAKRLYKIAFEHELEAAMAFISDSNEEPSRSILLRSAASLAIDADELFEAFRIIALAKTKHTPEAILTELSDLKLVCEEKCRRVKAMETVSQLASIVEPGGRWSPDAKLNFASDTEVLRKKAGETLKALYSLNDHHRRILLNWCFDETWADSDEFVSAVEHLR